MYACMRGIRTQEEPGVLAGWGLVRGDTMTGRASVDVSAERRSRATVETNLLGALLLFHDFLFLGYKFSFVLEAEGERESD